MSTLANLCCRGCGRAEMEMIIDFGLQPVAHRVQSSPDADEVRFGFALAVCRQCALVQVPSPIPPAELYTGFNFNFSSWKTEPNEPDEVDWICAGGAPQSVCEVGINDGRFLDLLRACGARRCLGIEPNPVAAQRARDRGFEVIGDFLTADLANRILASHEQFKLIVFREVLEHVPDIDSFMSSVKRLLAPGGRVFLDVPDFNSSLASGDGSTLWEEHVSYFTELTLQRALFKAGFELDSIRRYDFSGGCLAAMFRHRGRDSIVDLRAAPREIEAALNYGQRIDDYRKRMRFALQRKRAAGWTVALYGAGVRACAFSNFLGLGDMIDVAIDDQPERQGLYLPGARTPIRRLDDVRQGASGTIFLLAVNNENEHNVLPKIANLPGTPQVFTICGPRDIWSELARLEADAG